MSKARREKRKAKKARERRSFPSGTRFKLTPGPTFGFVNVLTPILEQHRRMTLDEAIVQGGTTR